MVTPFSGSSQATSNQAPRLSSSIINDPVRQPDLTGVAPNSIARDTADPNSPGNKIDVPLNGVWGDGALNRLRDGNGGALRESWHDAKSFAELLRGGRLTENLAQLIGYQQPGIPITDWLTVRLTDGRTIELAVDAAAERLLIHGDIDLRAALGLSALISLSLDRPQLSLSLIDLNGKLIADGRWIELVGAARLADLTQLDVTFDRRRLHLTLADVELASFDSDGLERWINQIAARQQPLHDLPQLLTQLAEARGKARKDFLLDRLNQWWGTWRDGLITKLPPGLDPTALLKTFTINDWLSLRVSNDASLGLMVNAAHDWLLVNAGKFDIRVGIGLVVLATSSLLNPDFRVALADLRGKLTVDGDWGATLADLRLVDFKAARFVADDRHLSFKIGDQTLFSVSSADGIQADLEKFADRIGLDLEGIDWNRPWPELRQQVESKLNQGWERISHQPLTVKLEGLSASGSLAEGVSRLGWNTIDLRVPDFVQFRSALAKFELVTNQLGLRAAAETAAGGLIALQVGTQFDTWLNGRSIAGLSIDAGGVATTIDLPDFGFVRKRGDLDIRGSLAAYLKANWQGEIQIDRLAGDISARFKDHNYHLQLGIQDVDLSFQKSDRQLIALLRPRSATSTVSMTFEADHGGILRVTDAKGMRITVRQETNRYRVIFSDTGEIGDHGKFSVEYKPLNLKVAGNRTLVIDAIYHQIDPERVTQTAEATRDNPILRHGALAFGADQLGLGAKLGPAQLTGTILLAQKNSSPSARHPSTWGLHSRLAFGGETGLRLTTGAMLDGTSAVTVGVRSDGSAGSHEGFQLAGVALGRQISLPASATVYQGIQVATESGNKFSMAAGLTRSLLAEITDVVSEDTRGAVWVGAEISKRGWGAGLTVVTDGQKNVQQIQGNLRLSF